METRIGLSYEGALLVPQCPPVDSRSDVGLSTNVTLDLCLDTPFVSAAMDTVTEAELAGTLSSLGDLGVVHHFFDVDEQVRQVRRVAEVGGTVVGAVGINEDYLGRTETPLDAGADAIVMDIAYGHMEPYLDAVERIRDEFGPEIVAGNVATSVAIENLWETDAGCAKVGVGPGSHCMTREVAGTGYLQLMAVPECAERTYDLGIHVMADGGIQTSGDAVKALVAGVDTVMMDSFFVGTDEAPGRVVEVDGRTYKRFRGMAFTGAADDREDKQSDVNVDEGVEALTSYKGLVEPLVGELLGGIRSGVSYHGGHALADVREKASFAHVAANAKEREGAHGVIFTEGPVEVDEEAERELQAPMAD